MNAATIGDEALELVMRQIVGIARAEHVVKEPAPGSDPSLDAIVIGLNMLAEEVAAERARKLEDAPTAESAAARKEADRARMMQLAASGLAHDFNNLLALTRSPSCSAASQVPRPGYPSSRRCRAPLVKRQG